MSSVTLPRQLISTEHSNARFSPKRCHPDALPQTPRTTEAGNPPVSRSDEAVNAFLNLISCFLILAGSAAAFELPANSNQCILGTAKDWNSSYVTLALYQKNGDKWQQLGASWNGRLGKSGLVWGRGVSPVPRAATTKKEGDNRAPAGVFTLGGAWGYDAKVRKNPAQFYRQVTPRDLWVEDASSTSYNRNVIIDHDPSTDWEKKQQMKQNDPAHKLKLFIAHNAPPNATPNAGSAIFFHIWRSDGAKPTAGCTTMPEEKLRWLIANIDPAKHPVYVLLPLAEYQAKKVEWALP
jgi:L,D-peptidoglycan transpeptidase YkuD (ErfK/YbiS/YcfS/YnhG family)